MDSLVEVSLTHPFKTLPELHRVPFILRLGLSDCFLCGIDTVSGLLYRIAIASLLELFIATVILEFLWFIV